LGLRLCVRGILIDRDALANARRAPALLWCAALCGALGCDDGRGGASPASAAPTSTAPASASPAPHAGPAPRAAGGPLEPAAARSLALSDPAGAGAVDGEIRAIQKQIALAGQKTDPWILLGRAWVRKARESTDPGFYLNADACADVALDIEPGNRMSLDLRGLALISDHRFADARDLADQILAKDPDDVMAIGTSAGCSGSGASRGVAAQR
jgi:hypothetical protein